MMAKAGYTGGTMGRNKVLTLRRQGFRLLQVSSDNCCYFALTYDRILPYYGHV